MFLSPIHFIELVYVSVFCGERRLLAGRVAADTKNVREELYMFEGYEEEGDCYMREEMIF